MGLFVTVNGDGYATAYKDILDTCMLPTLWRQFGESRDLFQLVQSGLHKDMGGFGVINLSGLHKAPTSTPLNTIGMN